MFVQFFAFLRGAKAKHQAAKHSFFTLSDGQVEPSGKTGPQAVSWLILWGAVALSRVRKGDFGSDLGMGQRFSGIDTRYPVVILRSELGNHHFLLKVNDIYMGFFP